MSETVLDVGRLVETARSLDSRCRDAGLKLSDAKEEMAALEAELLKAFGTSDLDEAQASLAEEGERLRAEEAEIIAKLEELEV